MRASRFVAALLAVAIGVSNAAAAEKFPSRPIRFVVGFLAGGPNDAIARMELPDRRAYQQMLLRF